MPAQPRPLDPIPSDASSTVETIALAYLEAARQDAQAAIRQVIADALTDLCEAERRSLRRDRLISRGYVRGGLDPEGRGAAPSSVTSGAT